MRFSRIRDLQDFHVYATCEFFAYMSLVSFSRIRDLRVFHVYATCEFFTYTSHGRHIQMEGQGH